MNIKRYQIAPGKHLVLPKALKAAAGANHMRMHSSAIVELDLDDPNVRLFQRFLANRVKLGDLIEVGPEVQAPPPPAEEPIAAPKRFEVNPPLAQGGK